jgi:LEA14-like dessication related protein
MKTGRPGGYRRIAGGLLVFALSLAIGGCASLYRTVLEKPEVRLVNLELVELGMVRQQYRLTLQIHNPNPVPLPVDGITYQVRLAGLDLASGTTEEGFRIPAGGETQVSMLVDTDLMQMLGQLGNLLSSPGGRLGYEVVGEVDVGLPFGGRIPFDQSGSVVYRGPRG